MWPAIPGLADAYGEPAEMDEELLTKLKKLNIPVLTQAVTCVKRLPLDAKASSFHNYNDKRSDLRYQSF